MHFMRMMKEEEKHEIDSEESKWSSVSLGSSRSRRRADQGLGGSGRREAGDRRGGRSSPQSVLVHWSWWGHTDGKKCKFLYYFNYKK